MSTSIRAVVFVAVAASCGGKTPPPPSNDPPPPPPSEGSGSATSNPEGAVCGTRGAAACPADMFCSYAAGADCGETDKPGHCMKPPEMCAEIYQPVCGCDHKTYSNACSAASARAGVRSTGDCK